MPSREASARGLRATAVSWVVWWVVCMGLWLLLTSTVQGSEVVVGLGAATVGATVGAIVPTPLAFRLRWLRPAWAVPVGIARDTGVVFGVLFRVLRGGRPRGALVAVPFRHGGESSVDQTRRALASVAVTAAPNSFVIGIDPERDELLTHQLRADPAGLQRQLGRR